MKVLSIGSDRKLFEEGSSVRGRIKKYGALVDELRIIVFAKKSLGLKDQKIAQNIWVYPTDSTSRWTYVNDATTCAERIAKEVKFSLVTTQDPFESGWVGVKLKEKLGMPLEVQLHADPFSKGFNGFLNLIRKQIMGRVFKKADSIRVVRPKLKNQIIQTYGIDANKIMVLPIYIDRSRFTGEPKFDLRSDERLKKFNHIVLTVSRLSKEKNLRIIIEAMVHIKGSALVIVGSGPEERNLRDLAKEKGINDRVFFEGWKEDLLPYYKGADVLAQASSFEGYGMTIVEAAMCGLPVVATPTGVSEDVAGMITAGGVNEFAERINYLLHNEAYRLEQGEILKEALKLDTEAEFLTKLEENWQKISKNE